MSCEGISILPASSENNLENTSSSSATTSPPDLQEEVWSKIFAYLPLEDRNSVRLTCRHFYKACDRLLVQEDEEIVLSEHRNTDTMIQTWSRADRKLRNVKISKTHLMDDSILDIFEKRGHFIHSVNLYKCELAPGILKQMIEHCKSLRSVSLVRVRSQKNVFDDFLALERNSIVRADVTNFTFVLKKRDSHQFHLSNCKFLRFFAVFPNIRNLEVKVQVDAQFNHFSTLSSDINSDAVFSFSCICDQISKMRNQLEKLSLFFLDDLDESRLYFRSFTQISRLEMPNLKQLSLKWIDLWHPPMEIPFLPFGNVTYFDCIIRAGTLRSCLASKFIELLLTTASKIRTLIIGVTSDVIDWYSFLLDKKCFMALVRSQLRNLELYSYHESTKKYRPFQLAQFCFELSPAEDALLIPNRTLKCLKFNLRDADFPKFATYFQSMECIVTEETKTNVLQTILKYQKQLRSLNLCNYEDFPDEYCTHKDSSFLQQWLKNENPVNRTFDNLTHLDVLEQENFDLSVFLLGEFEFPKLQTLVMKQNVSSITLRPDTIDSVLRSIRNLNELKYLEVDSTFEIRFVEVLELCQALPKLRYFLTLSDGVDLFDDLEYRQLFQVCPSLVAFIHKNSITYYKDVITNTVATNIIPWTDNVSVLKIPKKYREYVY